MTRIRLKVDWTRCDGHGLCASLFPTGIHLDDWGFPVVDEKALGDREVRHARAAALACPTLALRLTRTADRAPG